MRPGDQTESNAGSDTGACASYFVAGTEVRLGDGGLAPMEALNPTFAAVNRLGRRAKIAHCQVSNHKGRGVRFRAAGMLDPIICTPNQQFWVIRHEQVECWVDHSYYCKPDTCRKLAICQEHHCARSTFRYEPAWIAAEDLRLGDHITVAVPDADVGKRQRVWSSAFARLLGYFLARGWYARSEHQIDGLAFAFDGSENGAIVQDLGQCLGSLQQQHADLQLQRVRGSGTERGFRIQVASRSLATLIAAVVGERADAYQLAEETYQQTPEILAHLIAGYVDGDRSPVVHRHITGKGPEVRYFLRMHSRRLALDLQWLLGKLNAPAAVERATTYEVSFLNRFSPFLQRLCRKCVEYQEQQARSWSFAWNGFICRPIREAVTIELDGPVYQLVVPDDHSFTVGNGAVTQNASFPAGRP